MVEKYTKDFKETVCHGAVIRALATGFTMIGKSLIKMNPNPPPTHPTQPSSLGKFDVEDGVKLVAIIAISDFTKDYLIKPKLISDNI